MVENKHIDVEKNMPGNYKNTKKKFEFKNNI